MRRPETRRAREASWTVFESAYLTASPPPWADAVGSPTLYIAFKRLLPDGQRSTCPWMMKKRCASVGKDFDCRAPEFHYMRHTSLRGDTLADAAPDSRRLQDSIYWSTYRNLVVVSIGGISRCRRTSDCCRSGSSLRWPLKHWRTRDDRRSKIPRVWFQQSCRRLQAKTIMIDRA